MYRYFCSFLFFSLFFPFEVFQCTECKFVLVLKKFFFLRPNLEFWPVFTETPKIDRNDPKFFQSGIRTSWAKFLESPLIIGVYFIIFIHFHFVLHDNENYLDLINIDKKSLMVITNNYDTKKKNCPNIIKIIPILLLLLIIFF